MSLFLMGVSLIEKILNIPHSMKVLLMMFSFKLTLTKFLLVQFGQVMLPIQITLIQRLFYGGRANLASCTLILVLMAYGRT